jgi:hypothetical protein
VVRWLKRWLRRHRLPQAREPDLKDSDPHVHAARRRLLASMRLVDKHALKSARALRRLNRVLALRARAFDSISAAESALNSMDEARDHDK